MFAVALYSSLSVNGHINTVNGTLGVDGVGCYIWYSEEEPMRAAAPPSPLLAVPNVTASVPTSFQKPKTDVVFLSVV